MTQIIFKYVQAEDTRLKVSKYIHIRRIFQTDRTSAMELFEKTVNGF